MEAEFSLLCVSISLVITLIYLLIIRQKPSRSGQLPPGPQPHPIVGNLLQIRGDKPHQTFARLAKTYGPIMTLRLGQVTTIVISSPDMAREVLQKNDLAFSGRSVPDAIRVMRQHEVSMAWLPANQLWKNLRRIYSTQLFTSHSLDAGQSLRRQKVQEVIAHVSQCRDLQAAVDIGSLAFATILNLISNTIFSVDFVNLKSGSSQEFKDVVEKIMKEGGSPNLADFFPWLRVFDPQGRRRRMAFYFKKLHAMFDQHIDRRLQAMSEDKTTSPKSHGDFLDALLHGGENIGYKLDRFTMKTLMDLFGAGSETSSITVEWTMAEMLRNPKVMAKAREEILSAIEPGKEVEESDISKLQYLQAVVKETLRMHPPGPLLLPHKAEQATELAVYVVPKDARVLVNVWAIARDSEVWSEPDVFMPERFLEKKDIDVRGRDFGLIPFGAGRRMWPGMALALRMVHLILASLLQCFEWKLPDGMMAENMDMSEKSGITLAMAIPLRAIPVVP